MNNATMADRIDPTVTNYARQTIPANSRQDGLWGIEMVAYAVAIVMMIGPLFAAYAGYMQ